MNVVYKAHVPALITCLTVKLFLNPLTPNPYCTESLPSVEGLGGAAAECNKRFFPKITARLVFKIKSSFFSPFLVNGYILSCKCQKCKKIILSYIYVELCYSENEIFHIFTYITAAVCQTAKDGVLRKLKHIFPNTYQRIKSIRSPD